ncbi:MAG: hypothetical protein HF978_07690 [Desulfobacteraceae bacterium]|nr:hypothetical protein [Desulfobacteraceae bacterium]MBC2755411.1 hypothetical protein [Desulfobacteraceae bacterium]
MENVGDLYGYLAWLASGMGVFFWEAKSQKNRAFKLIHSAKRPRKSTPHQRLKT